MMLHQKKTKETPVIFLIIFAVRNRQTNPQKTNVIQLLRFKHFRNNITEKLKLVGADEGNIKRIVNDVFGVQVGTLFPGQDIVLNIGNKERLFHS